jgi:carbamoyl-phosphate synthase small subunit
VLEAMKQNSSQHNSQKSATATLALADGSIFEGLGIGKGITTAEVVFNTSMYGYQEIMTDPSYAGQFITFTYPHIGNVGCNDQDYESSTVHARGIIFRNLSKIVSNFRATYSLEEFLLKHNIIAIYGLDTRKLVAHLRDHGSQMGALAVDTASTISHEDLIEKARAAGTMEGKDFVPSVTTSKNYEWNEGCWSATSNAFKHIEHDQSAKHPHLVVIDCGVKRNILRLLTEVGFKVTVVPATSTAQQIKNLSPDALFLSNGPGDPATASYVVDSVKEFLGKLPIFGICLGHQILGIALGGKTYKLKFGHRGGNHPVKDLTTNKVEITVQNHGFALALDSLPKEVEVTHMNLNDNTVEGLMVRDMGILSVQYHPESSPGPHDSQYLFERFFNWVTNPQTRKE